MAEGILQRETTLGEFSISRPWQFISAAVVGTAFIALCAHATVPLFFTPVPFTLQPFAVLVIGLLYGPSLGFATLALYLAEGASGLPVFQQHGPGGVAQLVGATGGYLLSYPFVAALTGWIARKLRAGFGSAAIAAAAGNVLILTAGATWLAMFTHQGVRLTVNLAVLPFLPGDALKVVAAAAIAAGAHRWRMRRAEGNPDAQNDA